jgi:hypothetical protein
LAWITARCGHAVEQANRSTLSRSCTDISSLFIPQHWPTSQIHRRTTRNLAEGAFSRNDQELLGFLHTLALLAV